MIKYLSSKNRLIKKRKGTKTLKHSLFIPDEISFRNSIDMVDELIYNIEHEDLVSGCVDNVHNTKDLSKKIILAYVSVGIPKITQRDMNILIKKAISSSKSLIELVINFKGYKAVEFYDSIIII